MATIGGREFDYNCNSKSCNTKGITLEDGLDLAMLPLKQMPRITWPGLDYLLDWGKPMKAHITPLAILRIKVDDWLDNASPSDAQQYTPRVTQATPRGLPHDYFTNIDYAAPEQSSKSGYVWVKTHW